MKALSLSTIRRYERMAKRLGVSVVARSKRGFMSAFKKAGGKISGLSPYWRKKRENFIKRHYAQVKKRKESLFKNNKPTRRHLAFIFWAWSPEPAKLRKTKTNPYNSKYRYKRLTSKKKFDPKSFRTIRTSRKTLLRIGCPLGKWMSKKKRCRVGTRAFEVLTKKNPDPVWKKYGSVKNYLKAIDETRKGPIHVGNGIVVSNYGKTIFIPSEFYEKHKSKLNESRYKKKVTSEGVEFRLKKNPDIEYHDRTNKYRGVTYMSVGHEGDGILWIYKNGKILTQDSIADEDGEEITHDTAFGPGWFWQGRYETSSGTLSVLPPFRSEDRKVPVKLLNLLISEFRPKKILAFI